MVTIPIGIISLLAGLGAYRYFAPINVIPTKNFTPTSAVSTKETSWPEVLHLSPSGLSQLTEEKLMACSKIIKIGAEKLELADPTNYGQREAKDLIGREIPNKPELIVIHETVIPTTQTIKLFKTAHPKDEDQASYHILIDRSGSLIRIVPDENRAYGSGYSRFGDFTVHTKYPDRFSINNVSLHISLESPYDGQGDSLRHSGYTMNQYDSLAKQVLLWQAKYGIPDFRVTTHASVDRSHSRYDPRSFRWDDFDYYHRQYARACGLNILTLPT